MAGHIQEWLETLRQIAQERSNLNLPPDIRALLEELQRPTQLISMTRPVEIYRQLLSRMDQPDLWPTIARELLKRLG